jgi:phosphinothricin acetyltransferase
MFIRHATESDLAGINAIYNHYVENAFSTFDTSPWDLPARREWFTKYGANSPHQVFVAVEDERIFGWACTSPYRDHTAFSQTAEVTAYIHPDRRSQGVGAALYAKLFEAIRELPFHLLVAGIALPNDASVRLHQKFGFTEVAVFEEYALKNGKFISSMWMQKKLADLSPLRRIA